MLATEKLRLLTKGMNIAQTEREAAIGPGNLRNARGGTAPNASTGIAIARALDVPADWLWDDTDDRWPPPPRDQVYSLAELSSMITATVATAGDLLLTLANRAAVDPPEGLADLAAAGKRVQATVQRKQTRARPARHRSSPDKR